MTTLATKPATAAMTLKDMGLFRSQCYIDGAWVDADRKGTIEVNNPATGARTSHGARKRKPVLTDSLKIIIFPINGRVALSVHCEGQIETTSA